MEYLNSISFNIEKKREELVETMKKKIFKNPLKLFLTVIDELKGPVNKDSKANIKMSIEMFEIKTLHDLSVILDREKNSKVNLETGKLEVGDILESGRLNVSHQLLLELVQEVLIIK